jgi:outer membrane lipoprotein-sorting protein
MNFRHIAAVLAAAALLLGPAAGCFSQTPGGDAWQALLKKVDDHTNFTDTDFSAQYAITQIKPGEGSSFNKAIVFRRDRRSQFLVLLVEPVEDKGKGYLMIEGGIWLYDPHDRRFTFTSAQDAFRNTNARNSDFALSNLAGYYRVTDASKEKLGIYDCDRLELQATSPDAPFPRKTIWVSSDGALRMTKEYSLSGQLLRTVGFQYQRFSGRDVPAKVIIIDELKKKIVGGQEQKETTTIVITLPSFQPLPAGIFTKEYLERIGK